MVTTSTASQTGEPTPAHPVTDTWLVIPLYNEATVVREVISQARAVFPLSLIHILGRCTDLTARDIQNTLPRAFSPSQVARSYGRAYEAAIAQYSRSY